MLRLASPTPDHWAAWALNSIDEILLDHAHCEKKAASTAMGLMFRYPDQEPLLRPLASLAREELEHFELVLGHIQRRGGRFRRQVPSSYAARLMQIVRRSEPLRMFDTLLCCAMIEARSCERMQRLTVALEHHEDEALRALYGGLLVSEARHHQAYVDLARELATVDDKAFRARLAEVAAHETAVIDAAPYEARLHSAAPPR